MIRVYVEEMTEYCYRENASAINALEGCQQRLRVLLDDIRVYDIRLDVDMITSITRDDGVPVIILVKHDPHGIIRFIRLPEIEFMSMRIE